MERSTCESYLDELETEVYRSLQLSEKGDEAKELRWKIRARDAKIKELETLCAEAGQEVEHYASTALAVTKREQLELEEAQRRICEHEARADAANARARESHELCERQEKLAEKLEEELNMTRRRIFEVEALYTQEKRYREDLETKLLSSQATIEENESRWRKTKQDLRTVLDEALRLRGELQQSKKEESIRRQHLEFEFSEKLKVLLERERKHNNETENKRLKEQVDNAYQLGQRDSYLRLEAAQSVLVHAEALNQVSVQTDNVKEKEVMDIRRQLHAAESAQAITQNKLDFTERRLQTQKDASEDAIKQVNLQLEAAHIKMKSQNEALQRSEAQVASLQNEITLSTTRIQELSQEVSDHAAKDMATIQKKENDLLGRITTLERNLNLVTNERNQARLQFQDAVAHAEKEANKARLAIQKQRLLENRQLDIERRELALQNAIQDQARIQASKTTRPPLTTGHQRYHRKAWLGPDDEDLTPISFSALVLPAEHTTTTTAVVATPVIDDLDREHHHHQQQHEDGSSNNCSTGSNENEAAP